MQGGEPCPCSGISASPPRRPKERDLVPQLCVLIPVRNSAEYIGSAVKSVLRGLPRDATLTVLDDASTDSTPEVLQRILDPRLRLILSPERVGRVGGANILLERTDSDYVARMDGDDITTPWRFRHQVRQLERTRLDATFMTMAELRGHRLRPSMPARIPPAAFPLHLLVTNPVGQPTLLARRDAIERVGGYRDVTAEDYDLWIRLAHSGARMHRSGHLGLLYRQHGNQTTALAQYRKDSWSDPLTQEAYRELCEQTIGVPLPRLVSVASDPSVGSDELEEHIQLLSSGIAQKARALSGFDRWYLDRTVRTRFAHARSVFDHTRQ